MRPKISAFIITYNVGKKLEACLESLRWADEVVIVDSYSSDQTTEIVRRYDVRFFSRAFIDFSDQKNAAMTYCSGDYLLSIDADEIVPDNLRDEILKTIENPTACDAYQIPRRSFIFGKEFRFSGTQNDSPVRLFKKGVAKFEQPIHETVIVHGILGRIKSHLIHFTYENIEEYFIRFNRYTSCEAKYLLQKNHKLCILDFLLRPVGIFLKLFIWQQGFRDGLKGFYFCLFSGFYVIVKYAKYSELLDRNQLKNDS